MGNLRFGTLILKIIHMLRTNKPYCVPGGEWDRAGGSPGRGVTVSSAPADTENQFPSASSAIN